MEPNFDQLQMAWLSETDRFDWEDYGDIVKEFVIVYFVSSFEKTR